VQEDHRSPGTTGEHPYLGPTDVKTILSDGYRMSHAVTLRTGFEYCQYVWMLHFITRGDRGPARRDAGEALNKRIKGTGLRVLRPVR
jgi:hypothetical protein